MVTISANIWLMYGLVYGSDGINMDQYIVNMWLMYGFLRNGGAPTAGWVILWEIPIYKWMITRGSPILGNLHIYEINGYVIKIHHRYFIDIFDYFLKICVYIYNE